MTHKQLVWRLSLLSALLPVLLLGHSSAARPYNWGEGTTAARWPTTKQINIFLPEHPTATQGQANDDVKTGIERWSSKLPAGITFNFIMRSPQDGDPTANRVILSWVDNPTGGGSGYGTCEATGDDIDSGSIQIKKTVNAGAFLKNLAQHEFGHVLGLDDDTTAAGKPHNAMDATVPSTGTMGFSARDDAEIASLYGAAESGEKAAGAATETTNSVGENLWEYSYLVQWDSGPEIPVFEVSLGVHPKAVDVVSMPPGWTLHYPPTFLDCLPVPTPTADTRELHFYASDPDGALDSGNPTGVFVLRSHHPPGPGTAHAMIGGIGTSVWELFEVEVPTQNPNIPATSTWGLVLMAGVMIAAGYLLLRRRACARAG